MKKRILCAALALAIIVVMAGCGDSISIGSFKSKYYNSDDYDDAVQTVIAAFDEFGDGIDISKIGYCGDDVVKEEADVRKCGSDQVMVLESTFKTDGSSRDDGFEPNTTYDGYRWVLTRVFKDDLWTIADHYPAPAK